MPVSLGGTLYFTSSLIVKGKIMTECVGIIGGSGLYAIPGVRVLEEKTLSTPFGNPSSPVTLGELDGVKTAFIARHGEGHRFTPSEVPYAANIYALKSLGVGTLISLSAVGSLREEIEPRHFVVPDQLFDRTRGLRRATFFGGGAVAHASFGEPFCPNLRMTLVNAAAAAGAVVHQGGTMVVMEGPAFSTRAESMFYRSIGASVIGMTGIPEAKLAREAGICYATLAMSTDYDCWRESEEEVTGEIVFGVMKDNAEMARKALGKALVSLGDRRTPCSCAAPLGVVTGPDCRDAGIMEKLEVVLVR
jgi:5'-methylthioadenosine phosphorylase